MDIIALLTSFGGISFANPIITALGIALVRTIAGWLENALENGKIEMFEVKQLGTTILRVIPQALGLGAFGIPSEGALITDLVFTKASKALNNKNGKK